MNFFIKLTIKSNEIETAYKFHCEGIFTKYGVDSITFYNVKTDEIILDSKFHRELIFIHDFITHLEIHPLLKISS